MCSEDFRFFSQRGSAWCVCVGEDTKFLGICIIDPESMFELTSKENISHLFITQTLLRIIG